MADHKFRNLPEGFVYIDYFANPRISIDKQKRLYFNVSTRERLGIAIGTRVNLAYRPSDGSILVDTRGGKFRISKGGYITAVQLLETTGIPVKALPKTYEHNPDESKDGFLVFNPVN